MENYLKELNHQDHIHSVEPVENGEIHAILQVTLDSGNAIVPSLPVEIERNANRLDLSTGHKLTRKFNCGFFVFTPRISNAL